MAVNPIMVDNYAFLFNCTTVGPFSEKNVGHSLLNMLVTYYQSVVFYVSWGLEQTW